MGLIVLIASFFLYTVLNMSNNNFSIGIYCGRLRFSPSLKRFGKTFRVKLFELTITVNASYN